ncbi:MAG: hypothetical protein ACTHJI_05430 [Leifsonia sp.]
MSSTSSSVAASRSRWRRPSLIASTGLVAAALVFGGTLAAHAGPPTASVTSSSATATANGTVTLTAANFAPNDTLSVTFDSAPLTTSAGSGFTQDTADASGNYVATAYLPSTATVGAHTITVTGATTGAVTTPITIVAQPTGSVSPASQALSAYLSTGVTATFTGFAPGTTVTFGIATTAMGNQVGSPVVVGASGTATLTFVPTATSGFSSVGTYSISAFSSAGDIAAVPASFTVTANPVVAPAAPVATPAAPVKQTASFTG